MLIAEYQIYEQVAETDFNIIYRAKSSDGSRRVLIRKLKAKPPTQLEKIRFFREYDTIRALKSLGLLNTIDVIDQKDGVALVLDEFSGQSLIDIIKQQLFDVSDLLTVAIKLSETLEYLHTHNVTHGNITPFNVLIDPSKEDIKLTNFGIESLITGSRSAIYHEGFINETLPYLSPEQTGRMNRSVDYRSDFYSLGITLFEMVTGIVPFRSRDPLELIHCHIARPLPSPELFVPSFPRILHEILMKLMAKGPEERYQSAFGMKSDLIECKKQLTDQGEILPFDLGKQDMFHRFIIPQKLYGREDELNALLGIFEDVCRGRNEVMLINGVAGIGKSALIYEIHKPIVAMRGYFIAGKYEQYKTDTPYSAVVQAFSGLLRQILAENEETIKVWRNKFNEVLGPNGGVMTDIFPELELITGKQPKPAQAGPEEARNRFNLCFESFVSVFASEKHPLVLFLDDLQWADFSSLYLLSHLILSLDIRFFLIIFAYRSNEVNEAHPFIEMIREIENQRGKIHIRSLGPLLAEHIGHLISDFLKCPTERGDNLGELIFIKTAGNPFFVHQFLKTLYDQRKIAFDRERGWFWDETEIAAMQVTENVIELMADKISKLSKDSQEILKVSSCIGSRFDLDTLSHILGKSLPVLLEEMRAPIEEGYVRQVGDILLYNHDRIREAAYSLIPEAKREQYHLKIGRFLFANTTDSKERAHKLFRITDQLNLCSEQISDPNERRQLFFLNRDAGRKAKETAAFDPALKYFKTAELLIPGESANIDDTDVLTLYQEIADTACMNGNYDLMDDYIRNLLSFSPPRAYRVAAGEIEIRAHFARQNYQAALSKGIELLTLLQVKFPKKVKKMHVTRELFRVKWLLRTMDEKTLLNLPTMLDERELTIARIYFHMGISANLTDNTIYAYIVLVRFTQILIHGQHLYSGLCFLGYAAFQAFALGDIKSSTIFGDLGMKITERPEGQVLKYRTYVAYAVFISHWKNSLELCHRLATKAYRLSREAGDQVYTSIALTFQDFVSYFMSNNFPELRKQIENRFHITRKTGQRPMIQFHGMILEFIGHLSKINSDGSRDSCRIVGEHFNEDIVEPEWIESQNYNGLVHFYTIKLSLLCLSHRWDEAYLMLKKIAPLKKIIRNQFVVLLLTYFECLTLLGCYSGCSRIGKLRIRLEVKRMLKQIHRWAQLEPLKNKPWVYLIQAELDAVCGKDKNVPILYDRAIEAFAKTPSPIFRSLSMFMAGDYYFRKGMTRAARTYLAEGNMEAKRIGILQFEYFKKRRWKDILQLNSSAATISTNTMPSLDLLTIMKSAQALSSEIVLEKLLKRIMVLSLESAGAQKGYLVLSHNDELVIEAEGDLARDDVITLSSLPIAQSGQLSISVMNYVARTQKTVVMANACIEGEFVTDPYININKVRSLLAAPMVNSGKLKGIIYLENNLATKVFSPERLQVLKLLASQAAISLENARLFDDLKTAESKLREFNVQLEKRVEERTAELKNAYEQIKIMAHTDPLTGLPNRRVMLEKIKQEEIRFRRSKNPFTLVIGDVDHFKSINDQHGHDCGDNVLVSLAQVMVSAIRKQDTVARWGGEEFLFLFPETALEGGLNVMEKIRKVICNTPFRFNAITLRLSMTFGGSTYNHDFAGVDECLKKADEALYKGKGSGRNQVVFEE